LLVCLQGNIIKNSFFKQFNEEQPNKAKGFPYYLHQQAAGDWSTQVTKSGLEMPFGKN